MSGHAGRGGDGVKAGHRKRQSRGERSYEKIRIPRMCEDLALLTECESEQVFVC